VKFNDQNNATPSRLMLGWILRAFRLKYFRRWTLSCLKPSALRTVASRTAGKTQQICHCSNKG